LFAFNIEMIALNPIKNIQDVTTVHSQKKAVVLLVGYMAMVVRCKQNV